jgi:Adenylate and Guanylate cyclase catalytic domain
MSTASEAASASSRRGWLPFRVAIVIVVVGLLIVTCGSLIAYVLYRGEQSVALLKRAYLEQVADIAVREVLRLPTTAAQVLRVQRYRLETGYYSTTDGVVLAQALAGALQADPDMYWVSYSEEATGRFMGAHRTQGDEVVLNFSDPGQNQGVPHELRADTLEPYVRTPPPTEPYEPRTRTWYQRTVAAPPGTIVWMPPYTFAEGVQGVTAAVAARDGAQQVLGVFTVFGAPRPDADHVVHAVTCGIEMQRTRAAQNEQHRARGWPPMEMGVGIDTGSAVVGNMGSPRRIKYGVVGNIVNVAARIETFTVGGQVLVSDSTRQALGDRLVADGPFEAEGKGVGAVIRLWEVLALQGDTTLAVPSQVRDLAVLHPPLEARVRLFLGKQIDRQTHLARLHRLGSGGGEIESDAPWRSSTLSRCSCQSPLEATHRRYWMAR